MPDYGFIQVTDTDDREVLLPVSDIAHVIETAVSGQTATVFMKDGRSHKLNETVTNVLASIDALRNAYLNALANAPRVITVDAKAASYTITTSDSGKFITTRGAGGAITFTLPTVTSSFSGVYFWLFNCVDQNMGVSAQTNGEIMFKNDVAANSVTYQTAGELIGGGFFVCCDGTSWLVMPLAEEAVTITVTT